MRDRCGFTAPARRTALPCEGAEIIDDEVRTRDFGRTRAENFSPAVDCFYNREGGLHRVGEQRCIGRALCRARRSRLAQGLDGDEMALEVCIDLTPFFRQVSG